MGSDSDLWSLIKQAMPKVGVVEWANLILSQKICCAAVDGRELPSTVMGLLRRQTKQFVNKFGEKVVPAVQTLPFVPAVYDFTRRV